MGKGNKQKITEVDEKLLFDRANQSLRALPGWVERSLRLNEGRQVVDVAIRLAEIRGECDPTPYLREAAGLLVEAASVFAKEITLGQAEQSQRIHEQLVEDLQGMSVPWGKIVKPGKREGVQVSDDEYVDFVAIIEDQRVPIRWKVYRSEEGFLELLRKHYRQLFTLAAEKLRAVLATREPKPDNALAYLEQMGLPATKAHRERLNKIKTLAEGEAFVVQWFSESCDVVPREVLARAKANELDIATFHAIWLTREEAGRLKTESATQEALRTRR